MTSPGKLKSTSIAEESLPSIGPTSPDTETLPLWIGQPFSPLICSVEGSPVKTSASPGNAQGSTGHDPVCGVNTSEPFAHFDHATSSWKTYQVSCLTLTWDEYSETWPRAGTMRNGIAFQQVPLAPLTGETESGLWPTPRAANPGGRPNGKGGKVLQEEVLIAAGLRTRGEKLVPTLRAVQWKNVRWSLRKDYQGNLEEWGGDQFPDIIGKHMNLDWLEWLMGYPTGWTDLED
jgi:hypothetical protein